MTKKKKFYFAEDARYTLFYRAEDCEYMYIVPIDKRDIWKRVVRVYGIDIYDKVSLSEEENMNATELAMPRLHEVFKSAAETWYQKLANNRF